MMTNRRKRIDASQRRKASKHTGAQKHNANAHRKTVRPKHHFASAIIAAAGIVAMFGILLYNPQPVAQVTAKVVKNFDFYCGYDADHQLLMCAPELSNFRYLEVVGLSYSENVRNNILAVYYESRGNSPFAEVQIYYDHLAVAFTCTEAYDACRQGYGKACIVNSLCPN